jgi:hypothetical protein
MSNFSYKKDIELIIEKLKKVFYEMFSSNARWTARSRISSSGELCYYGLSYIPDKHPYREHLLKYGNETDPFVVHEVYDIDDNLLEKENIREISNI